MNCSGFRFFATNVLFYILLSSTLLASGNFMQLKAATITIPGEKVDFIKEKSGTMIHEIEESELDVIFFLLDISESMTRNHFKNLENIIKVMEDLSNDLNRFEPEKNKCRFGLYVFGERDDFRKVVDFNSENSRKEVLKIIKHYVNADILLTKAMKSKNEQQKKFVKDNLNFKIKKTHLYASIKKVIREIKEIEEHQKSNNPLSKRLKKGVIVLSDGQSTKGDDPEQSIYNIMSTINYFDFLGFNLSKEIKLFHSTLREKVYTYPFEKQNAVRLTAGKTHDTNALPFVKDNLLQVIYTSNTDEGYVLKLIQNVHTNIRSSATRLSSNISRDEVIPDISLNNDTQYYHTITFDKELNKNKGDSHAITLFNTFTKHSAPLVTVEDIHHPHIVTLPDSINLIYWKDRQLIIDRFDPDGNRLLDSPTTIIYKRDKIYTTVTSTIVNDEAFLYFYDDQGIYFSIIGKTVSDPIRVINYSLNFIKYVKKIKASYHERLGKVLLLASLVNIDKNRVNNKIECYLLNREPIAPSEAHSKFEFVYDKMIFEQFVPSHIEHEYSIQPFEENKFVVAWINLIDSYRQTLFTSIYIDSEKNYSINKPENEFSIITPNHSRSPELCLYKGNQYLFFSEYYMGNYNLYYKNITGEL